MPPSQLIPRFGSSLADDPENRPARLAEVARAVAGADDEPVAARLQRLALETAAEAYGADPGEARLRGAALERDPPAAAGAGAVAAAARPAAADAAQTAVLLHADGHARGLVEEPLDRGADPEDGDERPPAARGAEAGGAELGLADERRRDEVDAADPRRGRRHARRERHDPAVGKGHGDATGAAGLARARD